MFSRYCNNFLRKFEIGAIHFCFKFNSISSSERILEIEIWRSYRQISEAPFVWDSVYIHRAELTTMRCITIDIATIGNHERGSQQWLEKRHRKQWPSRSETQVVARRYLYSCSHWWWTTVDRWPAVSVQFSCRHDCGLQRPACHEQIIVVIWLEAFYKISFEGPKFPKIPFFTLDIRHVFFFLWLRSSIWHVYLLICSL